MKKYPFSLTKGLKQKVTNQIGEELGTVIDIIVDLKEGIAEYFIIKCNALFGNNSRYFAIPARSELIIYADDAMTLNVNKNALSNAFGFHVSKCPRVHADINDPSIIELYGYR